MDEIVVTHEESDEIGTRDIFPEWRGVKGIIRDRGKVYTHDPDDYWYWALVESHRGKFYVGLPGLDNYHRIDRAKAIERDLLDQEVRLCITEHGL